MAGGREEDRKADAESRLNAIVDAAQDAVLAMDPEGRITSWNRAAERMFGWTAQEALGLDLHELIAPGRFHEAHHAAMELFRATGQGAAIGKTVELAALRRSGEEFPVELSLAAHESAGRWHAIGIVRDATEHVATRRLLEERSFFLQQVLDALPEPVLYKDLEGRYRLCNRAFADKVIGLPKEEIIGRTVFDLPGQIPGNLADAYGAQDAELLRSGGEKAYEMELRYADGTLRTVQMAKAACRDASGAVEGVVGMLADISPLRRAQEGTRQSEEYARTILENVPTGVLVVSAADRIVLGVNPAAERILGLPTASILGRPIDDFVAAEAQEEGGAPGNLEGLALPPGAPPVPILLTVAPINLRGIESLLFSVVDISTQKESERRAREAQRIAEEAVRAKGEFLANMSHEIRTPMNAVIGMTGLLLDGPLDALQRDSLETIRAAGDSLLSVINDILDFSKLESGKVELEVIPFDLRYVLESVGDLMAPRAQEKGLEFTCLLVPGTEHRLTGDPERIRQVLVNLVGNAVKFTEKGNVDVRAEAAIAGTEEGETRLVRFSVSDTGSGIPRERHRAIFESFTQADGSTTRRFGGTGLGLTISRSLVALMGGEITVESEPGRGSTFSFVLPLSVQAGEPEAPRPRQSVRGARILVADDNATNRKVVSLMLHSFGCLVELVESGPDALATLSRAREEGNPFEALLLDYQMPGMDGEDVVRAVRTDAVLRGLKILMLTSVARRGDARKFESLGCSAYLTKPVRQSQLLDALAESLVGEEGADGAGALGRPSGRSGIITRHSLAERTSSPARILLAEDNPVNQKVALRLLERAGHRADAVGNGAEAVEALARVPYDIVLMDIQMPVMDGYEATRRIRAAEGGARHTPVIAMTAHALKGDRERCLEAGMDDYVSKPIQPRELLSVVDRWAGRRVLPHAAAVPPRPPREEEIFDRARALLVAGGDEEFVDELIVLFRETARCNLAQLEEALRQGDLRQAAREAHSVRGAAANVGAVAVEKHARDAELSSREGGLDAARVLAVQLSRSFEETDAFFARRLSERAAAAADAAAAAGPA